MIKADDYGQTPLMLAASEGSLDSVRALLAAGADVNAMDYEGWTPLLWAACNQNKENFEIISELIAAGADVNKANEFGYTALMFAATFDRPDSLQVLIKSGSDIHAMNTQGSTALVLAESNGHTDIAEILNALMQLSNNFVRKFCDRPSA